MGKQNINVISVKIRINVYWLAKTMFHVPFGDHGTVQGYLSYHSHNLEKWNVRWESKKQLPFSFDPPSPQAAMRKEGTLAGH